MPWSCRWLAESANRRPSRERSLTPRATSHSQTVMTRHPSVLRAAFVSRSRCTFRSNLVSQNRRLLFGAYAKAQPRCRCQKHPWTSTTDLCFGRTMSGRPGRSELCNRKRQPRECRIDLTAISGAVFRPLIRDMFQLRCEGESLSTWLCPVTDALARRSRSTGLSSMQLTSD